MDLLRTHLDQVLEHDLTIIENAKPGSDERSKAIEDFVSMYRLRTEEDELKIKRLSEDNRAYANQAETDIQEKQLAKSRYEFLIRAVVDIGIAGLGLLAYDKWFSRGLLFESTGTIGSPWVKGLITKMFPKK